VPLDFHPNTSFQHTLHESFLVIIGTQRGGCRAAGGTQSGLTKCALKEVRKLRSLVNGTCCWNQAVKSKQNSKCIPNTQHEWRERNFNKRTEKQKTFNESRKECKECNLAQFEWLAQNHPAEESNVSKSSHCLLGRIQQTKHDSDTKCFWYMLITWKNVIEIT